ncbi:hypothetical protein Hdeb2414_s0394g00884871 [Helianthus debilis subsp. tardiflorus]
MGKYTYNSTNKQSKNKLTQNALTHPLQICLHDHFLASELHRLQNPPIHSPNKKNKQVVERIHDDHQCSYRILVVIINSLL